MATSKDEYTSLRQELLDFQNGRVTILSLALTASAALFAIGAQLHNPYIPLFALLLLHSARVQIAYTHYSVQRIATYIRIILEGESPELKWETASYFLRRKSIEKRTSLWDISLLSPIDNALTLSGVVAVVIALSLSWPPSLSFYISIIASLLWLGVWIWYSRRIRELKTMKVDEREAEMLLEFKASLSKAGADKQQENSKP